jgi:uncharacterized membrane-anchored protein YhcB (DUF1043 family)
MNDPLWLLAFVAAPLLVVAIGYLAVRLHERSLHRHTPAE